MTRAWDVPGLDRDGTLRDNAQRILSIRIAEYYAYAGVVDDPSAVEQHHNLRISAKRLRYTLELFRSVFGAVGARNLDRVRSMQEQLGTLHDHDVRIALIEDELATLAIEQTEQLGQSLAAAEPGAYASITAAALRPPPDDPRRGLLALLGRQYASRRESYERFRALWAQFTEQGMRAELVRLTLPAREEAVRFGAVEPDA